MDYIEILGAREHNLKSVSLKIPRNNFVLVTGVSGSGKSSLVQGIIAAEGQRLYLSQLNSKARQYFGRLNRPDIDNIKGLSPVVALDQISFSSNSRSTVGTLSEIYDYLRLLFARYAGSDEASGLKATRSLFSFNSPDGACHSCKGLGIEEYIDPDTFIVNPEKSIRDGAVSLTTPTGYVIYSQVTLDVLGQVCNAEGFDISLPWNKLNEKEQNVILYGSNKIKIPFGKHTLESRMKWSGITAKPRDVGYYRGMIPIMEEILRRDRNKNILKYTRSRKCGECEGKRLNKKALEYKWMNRDIASWASMTIRELFEELKLLISDKRLSGGEEIIVGSIIERAQVIQRLGIDYLDVDRDSTSLSVGEIKRLRLSGLLQNTLQGLIYTLDEPTVGLHPRDHHNLLSLMREISEKGNTVFVIDHKNIGFDYADYWIELGPQAGYKGGELIHNGSIHNGTGLSELKDSPGWDFMTGRKKISRTRQEPAHSSVIEISGPDKNNLKADRVVFLKSALNIICGVSGAGKSSLLSGIIYPLLAGQKIKGSKASLERSGEVDKVIKIDQKPIGRNSRSNPATYTKLFDKIRDLFGNSDEAMEKGYGKSDFSFNVDGGRCPECQGAGAKETGLSYLGAVELMCETCKGKRFKKNILDIKYQGRNIYDVLEMEVDEALEFFSGEKSVYPYLDWLSKLGLGYLKLGQPSGTLSGGEAQRIKLATELVRPARGHTVYLLDEPASGLHQHDIQVLLDALDKLIEKGHTLIMVEHDPDIVASSDWVVELGPESGDRGGELVFEGKPDELLGKDTHMSRAIRESRERREKALKQTARAPRPKPVDKSNIKFNGVSTNNLKDIDIELLTGKINAIAGVSGSGKTSLIYDTIYSSAQYYFTQTYSTYLRSLLEGNKPGNYKSASGLLPSLAIRQKPQNESSRSMLATISGIYPVLRLVFSRFALDSKMNRSGLLAREFSFNDKSGACITCSGLGFVKEADPVKLLSNSMLSVFNGAFAGSRTGKYFSDPDGQFMAILKAVAAASQKSFDVEWDSLSGDDKKIILYGTGDSVYNVTWDYKRKDNLGSHKFESKWIGLANLVTEEYIKREGTTRQAAIEPLMKNVICHDCRGKRLRAERLNYKFIGKDIIQWLDLSVDDFIKALADLNSPEQSGIYQKAEMDFLEESLAGIKTILQTLSDLGLGYLQLGRPASSLSSGEYQRARMAAQLSSELTGLLYLIDEPSSALHPANLDALWDVLEKLCKAGNTIALVDHNPLFYNKADKIIHLGPGGGRDGGRIINIDKEALPGQTLDLRSKRELFKETRFLCHLEKADRNNLKITKLDIPHGWTSIVGVSGSGKSSLLKEIQQNLLERVGEKQIILPSEEAGTWQWHQNPLTGLGISEKFRKVFVANLDDKTMSLRPEYFKLTSKGCRCENCIGKGTITVSLDFLGSSQMVCDTCNGSGLNREASEIRSRGFSFSDILNMSINELLASGVWNEFEFELRTAVRLGLGYLKAGQNGNHLSGGEKQRLILVSMLLDENSENLIYLFDEPGRGLHHEDSAKFVTLIDELLAQGNSVIMIEHNPSIIVKSDWLIELGPGGGESGGSIIYEGSPQGIDSHGNTPTIGILKSLHNSYK